MKGSHKKKRVCLRKNGRSKRTGVVGEVTSYRKMRKNGFFVIELLLQVVVVIEVQ